MFDPKQILYEDNHLMVVNKRAGELVQPDRQGTSALEDEVKIFLRIRDNKPGQVFLGVVHRVDRPVSGAVLFAKTSKALARLNEMMKERDFRKTYWAITEKSPEPVEGTLAHHIVRDGKTNRSRCVPKPTAESKEARLNYRLIGTSDRYSLIEIELLTGRHHQIRCQLSRMGWPIKGDLKYGASRSNTNGGIALHARSLEFVHPVRKEPIKVIAPVPREDNLWGYFEDTQRGNP
ncbi:MAG: RNA pseudouridine synthase [Rikenellaceae bacterium]|nr:RNA pseudouridine synthase [Rikenellaceae bacterium]